MSSKPEVWQDETVQWLKQGYQETIDKLKAELSQLKAERDEAIDELTHRRENFEEMSKRLIATEAERESLRVLLDNTIWHDVNNSYGEIEHRFCGACGAVEEDGHRDGCKYAALAEKGTQ